LIQGLTFVHRAKRATQGAALSKNFQEFAGDATACENTLIDSVGAAQSAFPGILIGS
jgi:hypothetical protein